MTAIGGLVLPTKEDGSTVVELTGGADDAIADRVHLLEAREIRAIHAAMAAGRPLLVRGEPGIGKSQLARAVAKALNRAFIKHVVDSQTEPRDLLWTFDAVQRLAEAQFAGALGGDPSVVRANLAVHRFVHPGPLWWVLDWEDAARQQCDGVKGTPPPQPDGGDWGNGCVLLLDEIDKAESEVPNGLLEVLGIREFTPPGRGAPVTAQGRTPLVIITTNEERALPDPFLRRCLVLHLKLPEGDALKGHLVARGRLHFLSDEERTARLSDEEQTAREPTPWDPVFDRAAELLIVDRNDAIRRQIRPWPGQAEYLDLLRAVRGMAPDDPARQLALLDQVREYTLQKHVGSDP